MDWNATAWPPTKEWLVIRVSRVRVIGRRLRMYVATAR
jgi:hypothetical protein